MASRSLTIGLRKRAMNQPFDAPASGSSDTVTTAQYRPYPDYKDSEVEWIGNIPAHWSITAARREFAIRLGKMLQSTASGPKHSQTPYFKAQHVRWEFVRTADLPTMYADPVEQAHYGVVDGDLLVCEGGEVGRAGIVRSPPHGSIIQNAVHRVRSMGTSDICFLMYLLKHAASQDWINIICNRATIAHLTSEKLGDLMIPRAPLAEQRAIAAFLDRETVKIDELVGKKQRLIKLLQEQRTALIDRVVTNGLDSSVPTKKTEVEWLNEIPARWNVSKLKSMVPAITVGIVVTPSKYYVESGVPCLRSLNIARGYISTDDFVFISECANLLHRKSRIFSGDVVVVRTGRAGAAVVVPPELHGANCIDLLIIRKSDDISPRFLYYYMNSRSIRAQVEANSVGSIQEHYNTHTLSDLYVPNVPLQEQCKIATFLDVETARIDALADRVRAATDLLNELRAALICAAVTGKIDVSDTV